MPALQVIQLLVGPVVMISAGGLLCLALYNRLAMIVTRVRTFHKETFDAETRLAAVGGGDSAEVRRLRVRLDVLKGQVGPILWRARMIRGSLVLLLSMELCMLACSLSLGLTLFWEGAAYLAFGFFSLGVIGMGGAMVLAIRELMHALDLLYAERETLMPVTPGGGA